MYFASFIQPAVPVAYLFRVFRVMRRSISDRICDNAFRPYQRQYRKLAQRSIVRVDPGPLFCVGISLMLVF